MHYRSITLTSFILVFYLFFNRNNSQKEVVNYRINRFGRRKSRCNTTMTMNDETAHLSSTLIDDGSCSSNDQYHSNHHCLIPNPDYQHQSSSQNLRSRQNDMLSTTTKGNSSEYVDERMQGSSSCR